GPALERVEVLGGMHPDPQEREAAPDRFQQAESAERVADPDRVVEVSPVEVDPAQPGPDQEVLRSEDFVPHIVDLADLREETVSPDVKAPPLPLDCARETAGNRVHLEDRAGGASLRKLVGGRQTRGPRTDNHDDAWPVTPPDEPVMARITALVGEPVRGQIAHLAAHAAILARCPPRSPDRRTTSHGT